MDVQTDHGLLVVSLDNCMTTDATSCDLNKANNCIYTASVAGGICGPETPVVQLATPVQCMSDIRQTFPRMQQQLTQLHPIQYSQTISYETSQGLQTSGLVSSLYQPMTVATTPLTHYMTPTLPILTPSPSLPVAAPPLDDPPPSPPPPVLSEPTYPAEGFDYFMEIQNFLLTQQYPPGVSDKYRKCLKKRAQNYLMVDGKLFLNRKQPKEVIMRKDQQEDMLSDIHVVKENGIHLGVKKMFTKLHLKYFWRGMYTDVVNFVRKCDKCCDQQLTSAAGERGRSKVDVEQSSDDSQDLDDPPPTTDQNTSSVWRKVEVKVHGPYKQTDSGHEFVSTMTDPESRWCCATPMHSTDLATQLTDFVLQSFYNYGFAHCSLLTTDIQLLEEARHQYSAKVCRLGSMFASSCLEEKDPCVSQCGWLDPLLERLTQAHPSNWDTQLHLFLFQYRIGDLKEFRRLNEESPFSLMFNHNPLSFTIPDEDKENMETNSNSSANYQLRRRRQIKNIKCRDCQSSFSSQKFYQIHHRKHVFNRRKNEKLSSDLKDLSSEPNIVPSEALRESTVTAVKALMEATKEERRRRGKYNKFSIELQEEMAIYAMKHGNAQAVKHFSAKLSTSISESTIRNVVKIYNTFTPPMKSEIGRFASIYGVESAAKSFSEWLNKDISPNLVKKFKIMFLNKRAEPKMQRSQSRLCKRNSKPDDLRRKRFSVKLKDEIGAYACNHSLQETIQHFSKRLQLPVKEGTVKRFYKMYVDKCSKKDSETIEEVQDVNSMSVANQINRVNVFNNYQVQSCPVTVYQLNPSSGNTVCSYQSSASPAVISSQESGSLSYQTLQSFSTPLPTVPPPSYPMALLSQTKSSLASGSATVDQQNQACIIPQHSLLLTQDQQTPLISHFMATSQPTILAILPEKDNNKLDQTQGVYEKTIDCQSSTSDDCTKNDYLSDMFKVEAKMEDVLESDETDTAENEGLEPTKKSQHKKAKKAKEKSAKKRGSYTAYSPEIRAEIGKYAAEHGSMKACQHFAKILGHDVPESTARGLREKYLKKIKFCKVTSLGYYPRGRPLRLGKYDEVVQECLRELVRSGEKVSSHLAITTAKQILNKYEPSLLEENGGSLKLSLTWAKSFLKRIGVHNNS